MGNEMRGRSEKGASTQCSGIYCCTHLLRVSCAKVLLRLETADAVADVDGDRVGPRLEWGP